MALSWLTEERLEMSKINNLSYTDASLADGTDTTTSNYEGYAYDLRRTVNFVSGSSNNLKQVQARIYPVGNSTTHLAKMITYIANVVYGSGSGGSATGSGGQADFLLISGGTVSADRLQQVDMANSHTTDSITVSAVTVSWTNSNANNPASLTSIEMNGLVRWSGSESASGATITLTSAFTLSANTTYDNTGIFNFSQNIRSVTLTFIMSDGTSTAAIIF